MKEKEIEKDKKEILNKMEKMEEMCKLRRKDLENWKQSYLATDKDFVELIADKKAHLELMETMLFCLKKTMEEEK